MSQWRNRKFKTRSNRQHGSEVILSAVFLFFVFFTNRTLPYIVVTRERIHERTRFRELTYHFSGVHLECAVSLRTNAHLCSYMLYYSRYTIQCNINDFPSRILPRSRAILLSHDRGRRHEDISDTNCHIPVFAWAFCTSMGGRSISRHEKKFILSWDTA